MIRLSVRIASLAAAFVLGAGAAAEANTYLVVVNEANSAASQAGDPKAVVKRLFLKQQTRWPDGPEAQPMARKSDSAVQKAFRAKVLGMSKSEVQSHWANMKQTQGETPPREVGTALILFRRLRREPGAFTVLTEDELAQAPAEVKVLYEFEHSPGQ